jgi:hypothetical protein
MYDRLLGELAELSSDQWELETVCDPWTVADIVRHLVGAAKAHASMRELARQAIYGKRHAREYDGNDMDAMNDLQVADHADLSPSQLSSAAQNPAPESTRRVDGEGNAAIAANGSPGDG